MTRIPLWVTGTSLSDLWVQAEQQTLKVMRDQGYSQVTVRQGNGVSSAPHSETFPCMQVSELSIQFTQLFTIELSDEHTL